MRGPDSGLGEELAEEAKPRRSAMGFSAQPSNRAHGRGFPGAEAVSDALGGLAPPHPLLCKPQLTAQRSRGLSPALGTAPEPLSRGSLAHRLREKSVINPGTGQVTFCWAFSQIALIPHTEILPCFGSKSAKMSRHGSACLCRRKVSVTASK